MEQLGRAPSKTGFAARLLVFSLAAIFVGELAVMALIDDLLHSDLPYGLVMLIDALALSVISVPMLWLFLFRPLQRAYAAETDTALASAQALIDASLQTAILADADGRLLAINQIGAQRFGSTPSQMLGKNIYSFMPADVAVQRRAHIESVLRSGIPEHFTDQRGGRHFASSIYPVRDDHGQCIRFAVYADDVTERLYSHGIEALQHACDQRLLRGETPQHLLRFICDEVAKLFDLSLAWVAKKESSGQVRKVACGGDCASADAMNRVDVRWDDGEDGRGPVGAVIRAGRVQVFRVEDSDYRQWREAAEQHGIRSAIAIPLITRGEIYGAFSLYSMQAAQFDDPALVTHLAEIAERISVLLEMMRDHQQLRLLSTALTYAGNAVFITDRAGKITWVNPAFCGLSGYAADELIAQNPRLLNSGVQDAEYYRRLWNTILSGEVWSCETVERRKDGTFYTVMQTITPIRDDAGEVRHFVSIQEDISARKLSEERVRYMAHYDALTGLPNRALFQDRLHQAVALAKREGYRVALLFIDLDRFKAVNDELGHAVGDLLLQSVAARLRECVRESDTLARLAGDEFTVILPHADNDRDAESVADKIVAVLAEPHRLDGHQVTAGASIGIAFCPEDAQDAEGLMKCADRAMYAAKAHGRNGWRAYRSVAPAPVSA